MQYNEKTFQWITSQKASVARMERSGMRGFVAPIIPDSASSIRATLAARICR